MIAVKTKYGEIKTGLPSEKLKAMSESERIELGEKIFRAIMPEGCKMKDYEIRMIMEYQELKERRDKLGAMLARHRDGTLDFEFTNPVELLEKQFKVMGEYMSILEVRAENEGVNLDAEV